jgi:DNA-binding NarL/FixJ family response regulator
MHQSNRGIDPIGMLEALSRDPNADERVRAEAQGLLAFSYARSGDQKRARELVSSLTKVCALQDDEVAATLFLRLGNTALLLGDTAKCRDLLSRAVNAAASQGLWAAASRAHRSLALAHRRSENESGLILWHGQQASLAATRAGDYYDLQMSLLLLLSLETQRGDGAAAAAIEKQLGDLQRSDAEIIPYLRLSQGHRYAWDGKFGDAHRVFGTVKGRQPQLADRALIHSLYALCLILDGADDESAIAASDALRAIAEAGRDEVLVGVAALIVALSDILAGRFTVARRALRSWKRSSHEMVDALVSVAEELLAAAESPTYEAQDVDLNLGAVRVFGYGGFARYFELTAQEIVRRRIPNDAIKLTPSEVRILRALADGRSPKTIAADMNRSVLTIQTHIQNIAKKLGGHGRADTIAVARKLGLL